MPEGARAARKMALACTGGLLLAVLGHGLPAATWIPGLRRRVMPRLAGYGRPGHLALTFDDGPDVKSTPAILAGLERQGWTATFFMLGVMVARDPGIAMEVAAAGHEIGLHGHEHRNHLFRGPGAVVDDMRRGFDTVAAATGRIPHFFRPPYGVLSTSGVLAAKLLGLHPVLWGAWGRDWSDAVTPEIVFGNLRQGLDRHSGPEGPTVLLHDSDCTTEIGAWRSSAGVLPLLAEWAEESGMEVGPLHRHFDELVHV